MEHREQEASQERRRSYYYYRSTIVCAAGRDAPGERRVGLTCGPQQQQCSGHAQLPGRGPRWGQGGRVQQEQGQQQRLGHSQARGPHHSERRQAGHAARKCAPIWGSNAKACLNPQQGQLAGDAREHVGRTRAGSTHQEQPKETQAPEARRQRPGGWEQGRLYVSKPANRWGPKLDEEGGGAAKEAARHKSACQFTEHQHLLPPWLSLA